MSAGEPIYLDADPHNADWLRIMGCARELARWTPEAIDDACADAYARYVDAIRARHTAYFDARPDHRSSTHGFAASTREHAFPPGWAHLADAIPAEAWHRYHLSGGSSQILAVALLSAARDADPSLAWLPNVERPGPGAVGLFEVLLAPDVLRESPRQTSIDWLVVGRKGVIAAEAKFTERGFGTCSCEGRAAGVCSERVLRRPYWRVARRCLEIRRFPESIHCPLGTAYQAVRNVAAAEAIAGPDRSAAFLLLYDERNPYFTGAGRWRGWVRVLGALMRHSPVSFLTLSWQHLLATVDMDSAVVDWARAKHGTIGEIAKGV